MVTERAVDAARARCRALHALLVVLLLLASTGAALHGHALDEHRGGHLCGVCLANSHGGAAPLPAVFTLTPPQPTVPDARACSVAHASTRPALYHARAPPV
jgi:hypothetical protein